MGGRPLVVAWFLLAAVACTAADAPAATTAPAWFDGLTGLFDYPAAPPLELTDLYGDHLTLADYRGRVVVVSFIDKQSRDEAIRWTESLPADYLGDPRLAFVNVVFPGGISFLVPRPKVVDRLRADIAAIRAGMRDSMPPDDRERLARTTIRWAVDWKRRHSAEWGVIRHNVNVYVVDAQGRLRDTHRGMTASTTARLDALVPRLLDDVAAPASVPHAPVTTPTTANGTDGR